MEIFFDRTVRINNISAKCYQLFVCVNWCTDIGAEFGDVRPLYEARRHKLSINSLQLLDLVDADGEFITELADVGCIRWPQREHLVSISQPCDRNGRLLEFLTRRSVANFEQFIGILSKKQAHLVPLLVTDGGKIYLMNLTINFSLG